MNAALRFDRSARTQADLKQFWKEDPVSAAKWLGQLSRAAAVVPPELSGLTKLLDAHATDALLTARLHDYARLTPKLFEVMGDFGALQTARTSTIGWDATDLDPWPEAPSYTGTLRLIDGMPTLVTTRGSFSLESGNPNWRDEPETAFLDQTVTVKGFVSADGGSLSVEQFSPGDSAEFVSGRLLVEGDRVFISPGGDVPLAPEVLIAAGLPVPVTTDAKPPPRAEVTNLNFASMLLGDAEKGLVNYAPAGVILPGKVEIRAGTAVYDHEPESFYLLGRFQQPKVAGLEDGSTVHRIETGYFRTTDALAPAGLEVNPELLPGAVNVGPAGDPTIGGVIAAEKGEGRRTFFKVDILSPDFELNEFPLKSERRVEVKWIGRASDLGVHHENAPKAETLKDVAQRLPAAGNSDE